MNKYYNALTSFLSALVTFLTVIQGNEAITGVVPSNWTYGLGLGVSFLTGALSHLKSSQPTVDQAAELQELVDELKKVLSQTSAVQDAVKSLPPAVIEAVNPVTKSATDILDEVTKVIQTYQSKVK